MENYTDEELHDFVYNEVDEFLSNFEQNLFDEFELDPYSDEGDELLSNAITELIKIIKRKI